MMISDTDISRCILMMVGLPGSGKSYWARRYADEHGFHVHSSDSIRERLYGDESIVGDPREVFGTLYSEVWKDLDEGISVIIDTTALTFRERSEIRQFHDSGYRTVAVFMDVPADVCRERNRRRSRAVPEYAMDRMTRNISMPEKEEGFDDIWIIKNP